MTEPVARKRLLADVRPLRASPAFRRFWIGTALSAVGSQMTTFAVALQVYQLTRSSAAVGALGLTSAVPLLVFGLIGGSLADAVDRRKLVLITSTCLTLVSAGFAVQAFLDVGHVWLLYVLSLVQSLVSAVNAPARRTFIPRLLPKELLPAANALQGLTMNGAVMLGPTLAGVLTAAGGLRVCYLIDVLSFAGALYGISRLPAMPPLGEVAKPGLKAVAEGLRFIRHHPILSGAFLADVNATVLGVPFAVFPAFNAEHFGGAAQTLGLLTAATSVGGVLGAVFSGRLSHVFRQGRAMLITVAIWGFAIAGFGLSSSLWLCLLLLAVAGAADTTSVNFRSSMVQAATPDRLRGRVAAFDSVVGGGVPQLGNFEAGVVGSLTSPAFSAFSGGIATVLGAGLIRLALPAFTRYDSRVEPDKAWGVKRAKVSE
jgi:MFS family permease